jgi:anti-sigma factor RsiW
METSPARCSHTSDAGLYVLGELKGYDLDAFARHLQTCDECADEVELLEEAGDAVPLLAARHVPLDRPEQRVERHAPLLAAAAAKAKEEAEQQAQAQAEREADGQKPVLRAITGGAASSAETIRAALKPAASTTRPPSRRSLRKKPVPKPAMIGIVLVAVIGAATIAISDRSASIRYIHQGVKAGWTAGGGAAIKVEGNQAEVLVDGMPQPSPGTVYQVWVVDKTARTPVPTQALLHPDIKGEAGANVPGNYHDMAAIAVYVEPKGGPYTTNSGAIVVADMRHQS